MEIKAPMEYVGDRVGAKFKEGMTDIALEYIAAIPILDGVSIGLYALCSMISKTFAKLGVIGVFGYVFLVALF
ncbi:hypothetical protein [Paucisalibacillus sp. EB02]|uniref:hypothetical protein n=1 Tax=Paucisalibacillus sp. EB02 TaxID=1347087 RepID=UPI0005A68A92|nr:hypothetical protein [Paucisalibacillus sp. EB02]